MTMTIDRSTIVAYLEEKLGVEPGEVHNDTPLFSSGLLDSVSMIDLILLIEKEAKLEFWEADVTLENLDTIDRIVAYVESRDDGS